MFDDPKARRAWRRYRLRADLLLGSLATRARRELLDDLETHVRDLVANDTSGADEYRRVLAALGRTGDPREFAAPLLGVAVFRDSTRDAGIGAVMRAVAASCARGWMWIAGAAGIACAALFGSVALLVSLGSLVRPENIGVFSIDADTVQVRLLGGEGGAPILWPWLSAGLFAAGALSLFAAWRSARALASKILLGGV